MLLVNYSDPRVNQFPLDHDQWLQSHECGEIFPIYEKKNEAVIKDFVETIENPFDQGKSIDGLGNKKRLTPSQKRMEKLKESIEKDKDSDVRAVLRKGNTALQ